MAVKTPSKTDDAPATPEAEAPGLNIYVVRADGWAAGDRRYKGEEVKLHPRAAAHEPLLKLKGPVPVAKPKTEEASPK